MKGGIYILVIGIVLSALLRLSIFNAEIQGFHSWRQTQTMWNVRNFIRHDANILNPRIAQFNGGKDNILRLEFPIMQYTIALVHKILNNEAVLITRIMLFIFSIFSIWGFYKLLMLVFNDQVTSAFAALFLLFSPLFYYYSINPLPDVFALMSSIWYCYFLNKYAITKSSLAGIISALFITLAALSKLPFIVLGLGSFYLFIKAILKDKSLSSGHLIFVISNIIALLCIYAWYSWVIPTWGGDFVTKGIFTNFLAREEYVNILKFHLKYFFPHSILYWPVWILFLIGLFKIKFLYHKISWIFFSLIGVFLFYFYEFNVIQYVHDYYLFPFLTIFYLIVANGVFFIMKSNRKMLIVIPALLLIIAPIQAYYHNSPKWTSQYDDFNPDVYNNRTLLQKIVPNDELCIIMNDKSGCVFSYNVDKMGHMFANDDLPIDWIGDMILNHNVTYMYSDSRKVDQDISFQKYVDTLLLEVGSVHVYKLVSGKEVNNF